MSALPPILFDTLKACAEAKLTTALLATRFDISLAGVRWRLKELHTRGLIASTRCLHHPAELSQAGKEGLAAGPTRPTIDLPELPEALPAFVGVSSSGLTLLKYLHERALAGEAPTIANIAEHLDLSQSGVNTLSHTLREAALLVRAATVPACYGGRQRLTGLGVAVALGQVRLVSQQTAAAARRAERGEKTCRPSLGASGPTAKPKVPLTPAAFDLMKGIHARRAAALEVSIPALVTWSAKSRGAVVSVVETLRARKVLAQDYELTELGLALVEGRAVITRPFQVGPALRLPRTAKALRLPAPPAPAPPPTPRDESLPRAMSVGGKLLVHPPMPRPGTRPAEVTEGAWRARTDLPKAAGWS